MDDNENGWEEINNVISTGSLPAVPPTTDPQRLLSYVLKIYPQYKEMEMISTHLRLYTSTLEQDMEQLRAHVHTLTREIENEREKRQFLERYAAQVVKERNDILHTKGMPRKQREKLQSAHYAWHTCCKKTSNHVQDIAPSIASLRGELLQDAMKKVKILEEDVRNQVLLRKELDLVLKKTQRELDSKLVADAKYINQLEQQLIQRSALQSNLERKVYEIESVLAHYEEKKRRDINALQDNLEETQRERDNTHSKLSSLRESWRTTTTDRDRLIAQLQNEEKIKMNLSMELERISTKYTAAMSEIESLRSEIDALQSEDIQEIRANYTKELQKLQRAMETRESEMTQKIEHLQTELSNVKNVRNKEVREYSINNNQNPLLSRINYPVNRDGSLSDCSSENLSEDHPFLSTNTQNYQEYGQPTIQHSDAKQDDNESRDMLSESDSDLVNDFNLQTIDIHDKEITDSFNWGSFICPSSPSSISLNKAEQLRRLSIDISQERVYDNKFIEQHESFMQQNINRQEVSHTNYDSYEIDQRHTNSMTHDYTKSRSFFDAEDEEKVERAGDNDQSEIHFELSQMKVGAESELERMKSELEKQCLAEESKAIEAEQELLALQKFLESSELGD